MHTKQESSHRTQNQATKKKSGHVGLWRRGRLIYLANIGLGKCNTESQAGSSHHTKTRQESGRSMQTKQESSHHTQNQAAKKCKRKPKKAKKKHAKQQFKKRRTKANKPHKKCTCTTKFHTPPFLCDFFRCLRVLCAMFLHGVFLFAFFVRCFCLCFVVFFVFFVFSQGNTQKIRKSRKQKANTKQTNAKAKTRTFLIAFVLLVDCMCLACFVHFCCMFCAFLVHFCCICCALFFAFV